MPWVRHYHKRNVFKYYFVCDCFLICFSFLERFIPQRHAKWSLNIFFLLTLRWQFCSMRRLWNTQRSQGTIAAMCPLLLISNQARKKTALEAKSHLWRCPWFIREGWHLPLSQHACEDLTVRAGQPFAVGQGEPKHNAPCSGSSVPGDRTLSSEVTGRGKPEAEGWLSLHIALVWELRPSSIPYVHQI